MKKYEKYFYRLQGILEDIPFWFKRQYWFILYSLKVKDYFYPWDVVDYILHSNFEAFVEYYKCEFFPEPIHDWEYDEEHIQRKKDLDAIYNYWTKERLFLDQLSESYLNNWSRNFSYWFEPCTITGDTVGSNGTLIKGKDLSGWSTWESSTTPDGEIWFKLRQKMEEEINKKDKYYLDLIIKHREGLWT